MKTGANTSGCRYDEIKSRGVEDVFFISMDGVSREQRQYFQRWWSKDVWFT